MDFLKTRQFKTSINRFVNTGMHIDDCRIKKLCCFLASSTYYAICMHSERGMRHPEPANLPPLFWFDLHFADAPSNSRSMILVPCATSRLFAWVIDSAGCSQVVWKRLNNGCFTELQHACFGTVKVGHEVLQESIVHKAL